MKTCNAKINLSHKNGSFQQNEKMIKIAFSALTFRINSLCIVRYLRVVNQIIDASFQSPFLQVRTQMKVFAMKGPVFNGQNGVRGQAVQQHVEKEANHDIENAKI